MAATLLFPLLVSGEERRLELANGETLHYRLVTDAADSAQGTAMALLGHLAGGELEAAAALSNAPARRLEVLQGFLRAVGEEEMRHLFQRYFHEANRVRMEVAIGRHRLLVWDLGDADHHLSGQYFVQSGASFLLDDVPSATRRDLERVLHALRAERSR